MSDNEFSDNTKCYVCENKADLLINLETDVNPKTKLHGNVQRYKICTDCRKESPHV